MTDPADMTDDEIDRACDGLTQNAAKVRYLQSMGLTVRRKPNGKPLVNRNHYEAVMNPQHGEKSARGGPRWSVPA